MNFISLNFFSGNVLDDIFTWLKHKRYKFIQVQIFLPTSQFHSTLPATDQYDQLYGILLRIIFIYKHFYEW